MRSVKDGEPFLVMEEQTGKSGQPTFSPQPEPGQLRLWSYQAVAHGAMGINYFRWDTANFGAEEYWHGMLRHDRSHSPGFDEICTTIRELKALGPAALHARYNAEIALCYDSDADWALTIQPGQPDLKYSSQQLAWYGAIAASQAGVDIVDAKHDLSHYKVLCAPAMYVVSQKQAEQIREFVRHGGTFIAGVRLGVKDEYSRIVDTPLPGLLRDVMGCELYDYEPIYGATRNVTFSASLSGSQCTVHHLGRHSEARNGRDPGNLHRRPIRRPRRHHIESFRQRQRNLHRLQSSARRTRTSSSDPAQDRKHSTQTSNHSRRRDHQPRIRGNKMDLPPESHLQNPVDPIQRKPSRRPATPPATRLN